MDLIEKARLAATNYYLTINSNLEESIQSINLSSLSFADKAVMVEEIRNSEFIVFVQQGFDLEKLTYDLTEELVQHMLLSQWEVDDDGSIFFDLLSDEDKYISILDQIVTLGDQSEAIYAKWIELVQETADNLLEVNLSEVLDDF